MAPCKLTPEKEGRRFASIFSRLVAVDLDPNVVSATMSAQMQLLLILSQQKRAGKRKGTPSIRAFAIGNSTCLAKTSQQHKEPHPWGALLCKNSSTPPGL